MSNLISRILSKIKKHGSLIIVLLVLVFYGIILWMCISQMRQSNDLTKRNLQIPQEIQISLQVTDSLVKADSVMMAKMDSAISVIKTWNECRNENYLHGLNDLRQETNNIIDKQNGWLSFWIAILALVGALFPFALQLKMQQDQKQKFQLKLAEIKNEIEREKQDSRSELQIKKNDIEREQQVSKLELQKIKQEIEKERQDSKSELQTIKRELKKEKKNIDEEIAGLHNTKLYSEIVRLSFTLIACKENKWAKNDIDRNPFWNELLDNICNKTSCYIDSIKKDTGQNVADNRMYLKMILLQLHAVYTACASMLSTEYKVRRLSKLTYDIGKVLEKLSNSSYTDEKLYNDLNKMLEQMAAFRL